MWFHRWVYQDGWALIWPNLAAAALWGPWFLKVIKRHHLHILKEIKCHLSDLLDNDDTSGPENQRSPENSPVTVEVNVNE